MKVCIFGAASRHIDSIYIEQTETLCRELARRGHSLVFGAGASGLMGAAARGFKDGGGKIHGVIPEFFKIEEAEPIYEGCDELTFTPTMAVRKQTMEDNADAFIVLPGGIGTFEEFFEVLTLKQLGRHNKAIIIYNILDYYTDLEKFMFTATDRKFIELSCKDLYTCVNDRNAVIDCLENYIPNTTHWKKVKTGD